MRITPIYKSPLGHCSTTRRKSVVVTSLAIYGSLLLNCDAIFQPSCICHLSPTEARRCRQFIKVACTDEGMGADFLFFLVKQLYSASRQY